MGEKCFACGRPIIQGDGYLVGCADEQDVGVGGECYRKIRKADVAGYQPPLGGPRLYVLEVSNQMRRQAEGGE